MIYEIENIISGIVLGRHEAASEAEALDTMAQDAGYDTYEALCTEVPTTPGEIVVTLVGNLVIAVASEEMVRIVKPAVERFADNDPAWGGRDYSVTIDSDVPMHGVWIRGDIDELTGASLRVTLQSAIDRARML